MNLGFICFIIAAVLFLLAGVGATLIPNGVTWGFLCLTLGFILGGYTLKK
jgi:hypothetical protein